MFEHQEHMRVSQEKPPGNKGSMNVQSNICKTDSKHRAFQKHNDPNYCKN